MRHPTCPFTRKARAWWKSVLITREFFIRIELLKPSDMMIPIPIKKRRKK
jgi:hypothetical protein